MHIHTIEESYEHRMKNVIKKFVNDYGLNGLGSSLIKELIWDDYTTEFAHAVLFDIDMFAGDEMFEMGE